MRKYNYSLLTVVLLLVGVGIIMIFSASPTMGMRVGDSFYFIRKHLLYLSIGMVALYWGMTIDYRALRKWTYVLLGISFILSFIVYIPGIGISTGGATRWIDLYFFSFQPSELCKFALILFLAEYLSNKAGKIKDFMQGLFPVLVVIGAFLLLIIKQPDLGTAMVIGATSFVMLFIAGASILHLSALLGMAVSGLLVISINSPYRMKRLIAYLDPWQDPQNVGFHIIQSLLAVGSGGFFGLGLGSSRQKFFYLPQQFTDFVFAILCEEMGFLGGAIVVALFVIYIITGFKISRNIEDPFGALLCCGLTSLMAIQALLNLSVVIGLLPTTGIPLPFISYGGTSLVICLFSTGILLNLSANQKQKKRAV